MIMPISHDDVLAGLPTERRERILARARDLLAEEELNLRDLRALNHVTQRQLAENLGVKQDTVSRMERRDDMLVSTVSNYVEALGGTLRMVAEFPDRRPYTLRIPSQTDDAS